MKKLFLVLSCLFLVSVCSSVQPYKIQTSTKSTNIGYKITGSQQYDFASSTAGVVSVSISSSAITVIPTITVGATVQHSLTAVTANNATSLGGIGASSYVQSGSSLTYTGQNTFTKNVNISSLTFTTAGVQLNCTSYHALTCDTAENTTGIASGNYLNDVRVSSSIYSTNSGDASTLGGQAASAFLNLNSTQTFTAQNTFTQITYGIVPTGSIIAYISSSTMPTGFLYCNGQAVSTTTYSALYSIIAFTFGNPGSGNMNLPDMRGLALRGLDNGRGLDADTFRVVGSTQSDTMQGHAHGIKSTGAGGAQIYGGASAKTGSDSTYLATWNGADAFIWTTVTDGTNGTPRIEAETRMRNMAVAYIIKY